MTWTAKLNIDSINHRLIEYPDWKGPTKIIKAQLLPWPLSNAMEYKDHTSTLVWQESRMGQLSVLWNTTIFFPECLVPAGWIQQTWEASCATLPVLTGQITVWGRPETLPTHLLCPVWGYTSIPTHHARLCAWGRCLLELPCSEPQDFGITAQTEE